MQLKHWDDGRFSPLNNGGQRAHNGEYLLCVTAAKMRPSRVANWAVQLWGLAAAKDDQMFQYRIPGFARKGCVSFRIIIDA